MESDTEELTDDKTFLDRHERALKKLLIIEMSSINKYEKQNKNLIKN